MVGISLLADNRLASQVGLLSMQKVRKEEELSPFHV